MTSESYGESADGPALLRPRDQLLGGQSDDNNRRNGVARVVEEIAVS